MTAGAVKRAKYFKEMMNTSSKEDFYYFKGRFDEVVDANNLTDEDLK